MPPYPSENASLRLDLKLLAKFVYELNIARHHTATYPSDHPVIKQSTDQALGYLKQLKPENGALSLGISKNKLAIGATFLDERNPVFREFASHLFSHGIAVFTLRQHLDRQQLSRFLEIVDRSREAVQEGGGLLECMRKARIDAVHIQPVDYSAFGISEHISGKPLNRTAVRNKEAAIWERFVQNLLGGNPVEDRSQQPARQGSAPRAVAERLTEQAIGDEELQDGYYDQAITEFLRELDREHRADMSDSLALGRLKRLASQLNPELRAQLLNSTFRVVADDEIMAEQVLSQFPGTMLTEALETLNSRQTTIPPIIFTLLDRLNRCEAGAPFSPLPAELADEAENPSPELERLLSPLYEPDQSETFIPEEYSETLRQVETPAGLNATIPAAAHFWQSCFSEQSLERKVSEIIFELALNNQKETPFEPLKKNLEDLCRLFLDTGDFHALGTIYEQLQKAGQNPIEGPPWLREFQAELETPHFIAQILDTLPAWGKNAFESAAQLLKKIGPTATAPLLNHLAVESNRALRQFYMNCLVEQGPPIKEQLVKCLGDDRWYYLRNLIIILRRLQDPAAVADIEPLWNHPHDKVRHEVLKTALVFQDPQATLHLVNELNQSDPQRRLSAARMARHSHDQRVRSHLLTIFANRDFSLPGLRLKYTVLDSLIEQGVGDLLPHLDRRFRAFSLRHPRRLMHLRQRILHNLHRFPAQEIASLLDSLSGIKRPKLARMIRQARAELLKEAP